MSGKARISLESIIDAALSLIRESGWEGVSARSLAKALNTSTMPIYSTIGSMDALRGQARMRALSLMEASQGQSRTGDPLMDRALGYIHFAKREGRLFRFIFDSRESLDSRGAPAVTMDAMKSLNAEALEKNPDFMAAFGAMPREGMASIGFHTWLYVHGLACLLADGLLALGDDELLRCLETAGGAVFTHISRNGG